ncbi:MAG: hypothetical protein ACFB6R_11305 [Alphaproteobacteria bacterium]
MFGTNNRPTILSFDTSLLTSWYTARQAEATASLLARTQGPQLSGVSTRESDSARGPTDVTPPWLDVENLPTPDEKLREALATRDFVNENGANLGSGGPVHPDHKKLFALYQGMERLQTIAAHAAKDDTSTLRLRGFDRQFQDGLTEVLAYIDGFEAEAFEISAGEKRRQADTALSVPRTLSEHVGRVAHRTSVLDPMTGLSGNEVFTVSVAKNNTTIDISMDLSEINAAGNADNPGVPTLDEIVSYVNGRLEENGIVSRFARERIIEREDEGGDDDFALPPNTFGIKIKGVSTESLSFSAPAAQPVVHVAGVSGTGNKQAGQVFEFTGVDGTDPTLKGGPRLEPEEPGDEDTDTSVQVEASVADSQGNVYVTGRTRVDLGQGAPIGETDAFISKYDSTGTLVWTRSLGASENAAGLAIALDSNENVVVAGEVTGSAVTGSRGGGTDGFVTQLDSRGETLWTRQVAPAADDSALGLTAGANGAIYVSGVTKAALGSGLTQAGGEDATLTKLEADGSLAYQHQFGTAGDDRAEAVAVAQDGNLVVASVENGRAIVRKLNEADPTQTLWTVDLGDLNKGSIGDLKVDGERIYLAGTTRAGGLNAGGDANDLGTFDGGRDGFLTRIDDLGATADAAYTRYLGSSASDNVHSLAILNGDVIVAGDTLGDVEGNTLKGTRDGFVSRYTADGDHVWTEQYAGREGHASARSVTVDPTGRSVLDVLGLPRGTITYGEPRTVTSHGPVREGQYFSIAVDGKRPKKVTIDADETMRSLSRKIENVLLLDGEARVRRTSDGDTIRIEGNEGIQIELIPGKGADDALKGLGLEPGLVVDDGSLLDQDDGEEDAVASDGPLFFGLGLERDLRIDNKTDAARASSVLLDSLSAIRKAFNDLTRDPALDALLRDSQRTSGPVPADLQRQIANYQAGLDRLLGGGPTTGGFF